MVFVYVKISKIYFKWSLLKIAKTDMRNTKYALDRFIGVAGNVCKKWNEKSEIQK